MQRYLATRINVLTASPITFVLGLPRPLKQALVVSIDVVLCGLTVWLAFALRLDEWHWAHRSQWLVMAVAVGLAVPLFAMKGLYRAIFRYEGAAALVVLARAMALYSLLFAGIFGAIGVAQVPRTVGLLQPILLLLAVGASRVLARFWLGGLTAGSSPQNAAPRVLIYGAGSAGRQLAAALSSNRSAQVLGFLDDDLKLHGQLLNGLPIYDPRALPQCVQQYRVSQVLLAIPSATRQRRNAMLDQVRLARVAVRTLPGLFDISQGGVKSSDLQELALEDLLARETVPPEPALMLRNVFRKVVLVTGAGGSIGSELCRQIIAIGPTCLLMLDISEAALYSAHQQILQQATQGQGNGCDVVPLLGSVCDKERMEEIMQTWRPQTVYHAAAYKHVPLVEHNPAEGIRNNVWGTWTTVEVASANDVHDFVLVSSDKAVRPTNIMGASKRVAEMVVQAAAANPLLGGQKTRFSMVRFGNVLGSSGSVVPLFRQQIANGGPVTITHADVTRFFMTISEAAQLVIQAGALAKGGDVFVLDMGEPVRIMDLARKTIELSGFSVRDSSYPQGDIEIQVTGLRPGEKLFEELWSLDAGIPTQHERVWRAEEAFLPWAAMIRQLTVLKTALELNDVPVVRALLAELVPGYQAVGEVVDWVHLVQMREG